jgi:hypothetical protein
MIWYRHPNANPGIGVYLDLRSPSLRGGVPIGTAEEFSSKFIKYLDAHSWGCRAYGTWHGYGMETGKWGLCGTDPFTGVIHRDDSSHTTYMETLMHRVLWHGGVA